MSDLFENLKEDFILGSQWLNTHNRPWGNSLQIMRSSYRVKCVFKTSLMEKGEIKMLHSDYQTSGPSAIIGMK